MKYALKQGLKFGEETQIYLTLYNEPANAAAKRRVLRQRVLAQRPGSSPVLAGDVHWGLLSDLVLL